MDNSEARALLRIHLDAYRHWTYEELVLCNIDFSSTI